MSGWFTDAQMAKIRQIPESIGMKTRVIIERRSEATPTVGNDYGDDILSFSQTTESRRTTVLGWFFSHPTQQQEVDSGAVVTVNTYRVFLPVGTDISVGDRVIVGTDSYTVSDTTFESTWLPYLTANLRRRE